LPEPDGLAREIAGHLQTAVDSARRLKVSRTSERDHANAEVTIPIRPGREPVSVYLFVSFICVVCLQKVAPDAERLRAGV
jgi:hypothetical protein